jgi:hypothetical protein
VFFGALACVLDDDLVLAPIFLRRDRETIAARSSSRSRSDQRAMVDEWLASVRRCVKDNLRRDHFFHHCVARWRTRGVSVTGADNRGHVRIVLQAAAALAAHRLLLREEASGRKPFGFWKKKSDSLSVPLLCAS